MSSQPAFPGTVIQPGTKDFSAVSKIKQQLLLKKYNPNLTTSSLDSKTIEEIKHFQRDNQLLPDGIVGSLTWQRLFLDKIEVRPQSYVLRTRAMEVAKTQLFVREKTGHNDGKEVEEYLKNVGLPAGYPWCAAFVYWCFEKASVALVVPNPVTRTGGVLDHWAKTKGKKLHGLDCNAGDIFIMDFGSGKGHTGIVTAVRGTKVLTIEGNTSADPSYAELDREGNGVFERIRSISSIKGFIRYI